MAKIRVFPTKASALNVRHGVDGTISMGGSMWEQDGFTSRLITDGILTIDPAKGWRGPGLASSPQMPKESSSLNVAGPKL